MERQTIHLTPSKTRRAIFGDGDGFYIIKEKIDKNKPYNYYIGFGQGRIKSEFRISKIAYDTLKKEAKNNFEKYLSFE